MLSACSKAVPIVTNNVPDYLRECKAEPVKPNVNTGNNTRDFKNATNYVYELRDAGADCRNKLSSVTAILKGGDI